MKDGVERVLAEQLLDQRPVAYVATDAGVTSIALEPRQVDLVPGVRERVEDDHALEMRLETSRPKAGTDRGGWGRAPRFRVASREHSSHDGAPDEACPSGHEEARGSKRRGRHARPPTLVADLDFALLDRNAAEV